MGRGNLRIALTAKLTIAEVISKQNNDIGLLVSSKKNGRGRGEQQRFDQRKPNALHKCLLSLNRWKTVSHLRELRHRRAI